MTKRVPLLLLVATLLLAIFFLRPDPPATDPPAEPVSGALEALSFLGMVQTYPEGRVPERAHFAAWQEVQRQREALAAERGNPPVEPWESLGPHNRGGRMLAIAFNPQNPRTVYAGSASGGLWRSYSGGQGRDAWQRVPTGFPVLGVSSIAFAPDDSTTIYIGTGEVYNLIGAGTGAAYRNTRGSYGIGILKSTDGGQSWEKSLDWSFEQQQGVWAVKVFPGNGDILYAATTDGVYKSTDAGESWTQVLPVAMANDLLVHPDDPDLVLAACGNFRSSGRGIYRSSDGGATWYKIGAPLVTDFEGKIQLNYAPSQPDVVYASFGNGFSSSNGASWLYRSSDFGESWQLRNTTDYSKWQGWFSHDVAVHPQNPDRIVVIGIEAWVSSDGGTTLTQVSVGGVGFANPPIEGPDGNANYIHSDIHDVQYHPTNPDVVYFASDGGIHRSEDGGLSFRSANGRLQTTQFYNGVSTSLTSDGLFLGGLQDNGTIRWNGDLTWTRISGGDGSWTAIHPLNDDILFVSSQFLNVRRSTDGGNGFSGVSIPRIGNTAFIAPYVISPSDGNILYAGSSGVAKSTDGGTSWSLTNGGQALDGNNPVLSLEVAPTNPDVVYAGTAPTALFGGTRSRLFVTKDGGETWIDVTQNLPDRFPMDLTVHPENPATAFVTFSGFGSGHLFRTDDFGASWTDISLGLPDVPTNAVIVDPLFPDHIYVGNDVGVFVSTDGGQSWEPFMEGLPEAVMVFDLKISSTTRKLRMATHGNGAFQRDLLGDSVSSAEELPPALRAARLFPNPADHTATLQLTLEAPAELRLSLFDAAGRLVLSPERHRLQGEATLPLSTSHLPAGLYFLRLQGTDWQHTLRLQVRH